MGWFGSTSYYESKRDYALKAIIRPDKPRKEDEFRPIDWSIKSSRVWVAWEKPSEGLKVLSVHLIKKQDGEYWEKTIEESAGPYYYDCPERLVKKVPEPIWVYNDTSWRKRYWEKRKEYKNKNTGWTRRKDERSGDIYKVVYEGKPSTFTLTWPKYRRGYIAGTLDNGREVAYSKKLFTDVKLIAKGYDPRYPRNYKIDYKIV